jgi:hypothetical protein
MRRRHRTLSPQHRVLFFGRRQRGYVAILTLFLAIPLFAMSAFAADVGYWYSKAARLQRTVDAASLAGVVWLPDKPKADIEAKKILLQNGIDDTSLLSDGTPHWTVQIDAPTTERLRVTVTDNSAGRLFSQLLDNSKVVIIRSSLSEYIKPIPLGSPISKYGNDPTVSGTQPNFWASIGAPYYTKRGGDPYAAKCAENPPTNPCTTPNTDYRLNGYFYGIEVPAGNAGRTLTVQLYDAGNYNNGNLCRPKVNAFDTTPCSPMDPTDRYDLPGTNLPGATTSFQLLDQDQSPLNNENNPPLPFGSAVGPNYTGAVNSWPSGNYVCWLVLAPDALAATYKDQWQTLCSVTITDNLGGIFPLQVKSSNIPGVTDAGEGTNQFAIKASIASGVGQTRVYALSTMSVFTNPRGTDCAGNPSTSAESSFYLAEIPVNNRGKRLTISMFDPGDGPEGTYTLDFVGPDNAGLAGSNVTDPCTAAVIGELAPSCSYGARGSTPTTGTPCSITTRDATGAIYNGLWLDVSITLPAGYNCSADCWWKIRYRFSGLSLPLPGDPPATPTDRTTYVVRVSGDPVRVIA